MTNLASTKTTVTKRFKFTDNAFKGVVKFTINSAIYYGEVNKTNYSSLFYISSLNDTK